MNSDSNAREALSSWSEGDLNFAKGDYEDSIRCYEHALEISKTLHTRAGFDYRVFEAMCFAGLSGALGRLGKHRESLSAARVALEFYDERGNLYPAERGRWIMSIINQGAALGMLGYLEDSLDVFQRAKNMLLEAPDSLSNQQWLNMVEKNIQATKQLLQRNSSPKPSWKFWKK